MFAQSVGLALDVDGDASVPLITTSQSERRRSLGCEVVISGTDETDPRSYIRGKLNLMIDGATDRTFPSIEDAIEYLKKLARASRSQVGPGRGDS